jgi:hypothetical protein
MNSASGLGQLRVEILQNLNLFIKVEVSFVRLSLHILLFGIHTVLSCIHKIYVHIFYMLVIGRKAPMSSVYYNKITPLIRAIV